MATNNVYLAYKRDTKHLLFGLTHASNAILKSTKASSDDASQRPITTGQITVAELVTMSSRIAKHMGDTVPSLIYRLFRSVTDARTAVYQACEQMVAKQPDPEIQKSNVSQKYYIDRLTEAFEVLGGREWMSKRGAGQQEPREEQADEEVIFANAFSSLGLEEASKGDEAEEDSSEDGAATPRVGKQKKASTKGKKGKRGKKYKRPTSKLFEAPGPSRRDEVPLESYRIINDEEGNITDYLMAVYSVFQQWADLRSFVQGLWREVAYEGLNSATAGTLSTMAVAMVKRTEALIIVDFPANHDSYQTCMNTITRGDPEKAQGMFSVGLQAMLPGANGLTPIQEKSIDVKEQFGIHTYHDLLDFIVDFQKNRTGKPTKRMLTGIRDWDPNFNLEQANGDQRLRWLNLFSSIVVQRNTVKGEHHKYEEQDWSVNGPWHVHRRLFGLNEFAGEVTSLAMQPQYVDVRNRIPPDVVFQLQCIIDSLAVSRGWTKNALLGDVLKPPAKDYRPRRDVDLFLDRLNERMCQGFLEGVNVLGQLLEQDAMKTGDPNRHTNHSEVLKELTEDFQNFLGEHMYMTGLTTMPPSRFTHINANGLQEYSPYLCGVGLVEGLEIAYRMGMLFFDKIPEVTMLVHLHNLLVQEGYFDRPVGLYGSLAEFFSSCFFVDGKVPTRNYAKALKARLEQIGSRQAQAVRASGRQKSSTAEDIHEWLPLETINVFNQKSNLLLYREANWNPDRIAEAEIAPVSLLGVLRIAQTKHVTDPATGQRKLQDIDLVQRARAQGVPEATLLDMSKMLRDNKASEVETVAQAQALAVASGNCEGQKFDTPERVPEGRDEENAKRDGRELLSFLKYDIARDISGSRPLSGISYIWIVNVCMVLFMKIEDELREARNPLWTRAYDTGPDGGKHKRVALTVAALTTLDDECLSIMAEAFTNTRAGILNHLYWNDTGDDGKKRASKMNGHKEDDLPDVDCTVM